MSRRKKVSGGQALVMVTLALFSMVGMMGLAVDLGWSYFSQKEAQAVADSAALAAAQEAVLRLGGSGANLSAFTCASAGTGASAVDCTENGGTTLEYCGSSVASTSNLNNGCLYAKRNGFQYDVSGSKQIVVMQSGDGNDANRPPGVNRISYWVRVRTIQTIPQLFSAMKGNTQGTVAANGTAGIAGAITPGSFYGMNRAGDCYNMAGTSNCGLDIITSNGQGKTNCPSGGQGQVCAPAGVILNSDCPNGGLYSCTNDGKSNAAYLQGAGIETSSLVMRGTSSANGGQAGGSGTFHDTLGNQLTPTYTTNSGTFKDVTAPNAQPPVQTANPIASCGVTDAQMKNPTQPLGPYQYYHYTKTVAVGAATVPVPDGLPITVDGVSFSNSSSYCPGISSATLAAANVPGISAGSAQTNGSFQTFVFYGGLIANGNVTLDSAQYILAGVAGANNSGSASSIAPQSPIFDVGNKGVVTGNSAETASGSMFVFTDGNYPPLLATNPMATLPVSVASVTSNATYYNPLNLVQGNMDLKNGTVTMQGLVSSCSSSSCTSTLPTTMDPYSGIVWWQDRRNSTVFYDEKNGVSGCSSSAVCKGDDGSIIYCRAADCAANGMPNVTVGNCTGLITICGGHASDASVGLTIEPGSANLTLTGVFYQPRGAYLNITHGTSTSNGFLQIITGSLNLTTGDDRVMLSGPTNPFITYKAILIQ